MVSEIKAERDQWVIRKNGYFYRPKRAGYTSSIREAGRYSWSDAVNEAEIEPGITAHHESEFEADPTEEWRPQDVNLPDYWNDVFGGSYQPVKYGKHTSWHPVTVKEILEQVRGTPTADVIAGLVFSNAVVGERERMAWARVHELEAELHKAQEAAADSDRTTINVPDIRAMTVQSIMDAWRRVSADLDLDKNQEAFVRAGVTFTIEWMSGAYDPVPAGRYSALEPGPISQHFARKARGED